MPLALTVLIWVAVVCLILMTLLGVAALAALIAAALEVRALARGIAAEVRWLRERRQHLWYRARFAGKWLRIMSQRLSGL